MATKSQKAIFAPVTFSHTEKSGKQVRAYLLIDCDGVSGFQALLFKEHESATGLIVCRQFALCEPRSSLEVAERAYAKAVSEITNPDSVVHGTQPFEGPYADAMIITREDVESWEQTRAASLNVKNVVDPRKAKAAELHKAAQEREKLEQQNGFAIAINDPNAIWIESHLRRVQVEKEGGTVTITSVLNNKATSLPTDFKHDVKVRIAHELGGNFSLEGFFEKNDVFVVVNETLNDIIKKRLDRARPTVVRRAHIYTTPTERFAAVKKLLDSSQTELTHLRVTSKAKGAERYDNILFDSLKMAEIVDSLPPTLRESLEHAHSSHAAL